MYKITKIFSIILPFPEKYFCPAFPPTSQHPSAPLFRPSSAPHSGPLLPSLWLRSAFAVPPLFLRPSFVRYPIHIPFISHPYPIQEG